MNHYVAVGIDLGSTNCVVASVINDIPEVLHSFDGPRIIPSIVAFTDEDVLVGEPAMMQASGNPKNTIINFMKFIGRSYADIPREELSSYPVQVVDVNGCPQFNVMKNGVRQNHSVEDILTIFISKLKSDAEDKLRREVKDVVVAVPVHYGASQKDTIIRSCNNTDLNVLELMTEPMAVAVAYKLPTNVNRKIIVYNMGGTSSEVSVLCVDGNSSRVMGNSYDPHMGGSNFDDRLVSYLKDTFEKKEAVTLPPDSEAMWELKKSSKQARHNYGRSTKETINIACLFNGKDFKCSVTKVRFEGLCSNLFTTALRYIDNALLAANLDKSQIDEVILAGGACKMVKLQESIGHYFSGKIIKNSVNLDEVVALGAAIRAHSLTDVVLEESMTMLQIAPKRRVSSTVRNYPLHIDRVERPLTTKRRRVAIGIDLGTTNSCVGVVLDGKVEIIAPHHSDSRVIPSYVAFTETERLVGNKAKIQALMNPENTVFDAKRLIGRKYNDPDVQNMIPYWPFKVINYKNNPKIEVTFKGNQKTLTPEQISSMVLSELKQTAETFLGQPVTDAVITVPAYFNDSQRQATIDAGQIAHLNVLKIINEPTAAAIAYGFEKKLDSKLNVLIYDFGGGTLDVAILTIAKGDSDVKAVSGNTYLGGGDLDCILVDHCVQSFQRQHQTLVRDDKRVLSLLRDYCEKIKISLSSLTSHNAKVNSLYKGLNLNTLVTRARFEQLASDLFDNAMKPVETVIQKSGLHLYDIDEVILVGGSSRIPKIQALLQDMFNGKKLNKTINPEEAIAYGAAVKAAALINDQSVGSVLLHDVTPLSLGINVRGELTDIIIESNTKIPVKKEEVYTTIEDYQSNVRIRVQEGHEKKSRFNDILGEFSLEGIEKAAAGEPTIIVTFEVDANGILGVSAKDVSTYSQKNITITTNKGRLRTEDIRRMIAESVDYV